MFEQLLTFAKEQLQNNHFFSGGMILMLGGALLHAARELPRKFWVWLKCRFIIDVDIPDRDEAFNWINVWLSKHPYSEKRARLLTVRTERPDDDDDDDDDDGLVGNGSRRSTQPRIIFSPAPGTHYFFYKRRLVVLGRDRKDKAGNSGSFGFYEIFSIRLFTRDRSIVQSLLEEARELVHPAGVRRLAILGYYYNSWQVKSKRRPRPVESVVLRKGLMEDLIATLDRFLSSEDWYVERGIPYRLGILFDGPPGSGKSSAVAAIASHFDMDIATLNLAAGNLDDDALRDALATVPKNTLVLIEDIDCVFNDRKGNDEKSNKVTFSGLLNAIDGVAAGEGRILFMTTNYPDRLDSALVRPGRADVRKEIGPPDVEQICRIFDRFFPSASPTQLLTFLEGVKHEQTSMAALQSHLTKYSDDPDAAVRHVAEIHHVTSKDKDASTIEKPAKKG